MEKRLGTHGYTVEFLNIPYRLQGKKYITKRFIAVYNTNLVKTFQGGLFIYNT